MEKKVVEVTGVVDSAKFIGLPLGITLLTICIMLVDGFDLQTMSFVAPELVHEWGVERVYLTPVLTASMIGMALGSVVLGWLGDRIGRKRSYIVCIVFLGIGSLLSAHATGLWDLFAWRFITGIGLGGVTPLAATFISEWSPKRVRSVAVACAIVAVPLGGMIGAAVSQWIIPAYGWRMIFYIGAAFPLFFFLAAMFLLPESPKYLAQRPELHPKLAVALNRLLKRKEFDGTERFMVDEPPPPPGNWFTTLLNADYRRTTLLLWAAFAFNTLALYSFVNFLPTVLTSIGMSRETSLQGSMYLNFGGFFGAVGGAVFIGYFGSRIVGSTLSTIGAIATFFIGLTLVSAGASDTVKLMLLLVVAGMAVNGMQAFVYAVGAHSYPTYIRAAGVGTAQTVSRVGGVLSSSIGGWFLATNVPVSYFFGAIAVVMLVVVVSFFSLHTHIPPRSKSERAGTPLPATAQPERQG